MSLSALSLWIAFTALAGPPATRSAADPLHPRVKMETTAGTIVLQLDAQKAPITVDNFLRYAEEGYYQGTIFHRVIKDFMIQGGGYTPQMELKNEGLHEPIFNEWRNGLHNVRGTIAMARTSNPNSATSQFFINVVDNKRLDGDPKRRGGAGYCVFGRVVEGMDVVDRIRNAHVVRHPKYPSQRPVTPEPPIVIRRVTLLGNLTRKEVRMAVEKFQDEQIEKYIHEAEQAGGQKVQQTQSGLRYVVLKPGNGPSPDKTSTVKVHYTGWLPDGRKFDSSLDRGQPAQFPLNRVIPGWTEGVGSMKVGEKRRLIIPPALGYGEHGAADVIPPHATLIFDVELLEIVQ